MKCSLCGFEFNEKEVQSCCSGCGLIKGCELVKCPNCNFEMVPEPKWLKKLRERRSSKNETH